MRKILIGILCLLSALGYSQDAAIQINALNNYNSSNTLGTLFSQNTFSSLTGFKTSGSATATISGNRINLVGAANTESPSLDDTAYGATALQYISTSVKFGINAAPNSTSFAAWGTKSVGATNYINTSAKIDLTNGANAGTLYIYGGTVNPSTIIATSSGKITFSNGDSILLTYERSWYVITVYARNVTTNSAPISCSYTYGSFYPQTNALPNRGTFSFFPYNGTYLIDSIGATSKEIKNPDVLLAGTSKSVGFYATTFLNTYAGLLKNNFRSFVNLSGNGDLVASLLKDTAEIRLINPKVVMVEMGANDVLDSNTFKTNYAAFVTWAQSAGFIVYHLAPMYETAYDQTAERNFILNTYPASNIIDPWWITHYNGALAGDGVHPAPYGDSLVYNLILASGLFKGATGYVNPATFTIATPTLDQVLTSGNTTTQTVVQTGFNTSAPNIQSGLFSLQSYDANDGMLWYNGKYSGGYTRLTAGPASLIYTATGGAMTFNVAASGSGGITFTQPLKILPSGQAGLGGNNTTGVAMQGLNFYVDGTPGGYHFSKVSDGTAGVDSPIVWKSSDSSLHKIAPSSGSATGANPTATIGTSVVNGSATTFMRSDAAPAIPQATSSTFGAIKVDGTSIVATSGVISTALVTASASYTPTLTNTTNVTSSALTVAYYSRNGNIITVQIGGTLTPTTALSQSVLTFTLPITTTNGTQTNCGTGAIGLNSGTVYTSGIANVVSTTTGTLLLVAPSLGGTTSNFSITFVYTL